VYFLQLRVVGSTMGTREELRRLLQMVQTTGVRPVVDSVRPLAEARQAVARLTDPDLFGKVVLEVSPT
jgi:D-arabinose 1-dehydrogenase-like Zn-dependent alcohol dehydrogenase